MAAAAVVLSEAKVEVSFNKSPNKYVSLSLFVLAHILIAALGSLTDFHLDRFMFVLSLN